MTALVQSFPQQSSTVTMLQTRPSSSSGPFPAPSQGARSTQISRSIYNGGNNGTSYRGLPPVAPYAFTATPVLGNGANPLRQNPTSPHLRAENRTFSAPTTPFAQQSIQPHATNQTRQRQLAASPTVVSSGSSSGSQQSTKDDFFIPTPRANVSVAPRPMSAMELTVPDLKTLGAVTPAKPSPDRYRRNHRRAETTQATFATQTTGASAMPSGSGMATVGHLYNHPTQSLSSPAFSPQSYRGYPVVGGKETVDAPQGVPHAGSKDDTLLHPQTSTEQAKRYRRRSVTSLDTDEAVSTPQSAPVVTPTPPIKTYASVVSTPYVPEKQEARHPQPVQQPHPSSSHGRNGSDESSASARSNSRPSSAKRETNGTATPTALQGTAIAKHDAKLVTIPPRGSSDANKRLTNPSPLSKPMALSPESPKSKNAFTNPSQSNGPQSDATESAAPAATPESPAAQQLAALNKKEAKKEGKSSRLRRAFSFGSAAELRKASAENSRNNHNLNVERERAKLQKDRYHNEEEAQEAAIVQRQEAAGLGAGIYSGQGNFFTGSTDNVSVSSTASSASIMLRKMGKGVKKSTRSLVGLFRPKSVIGVPAADAAVPEPSLAQVSMVTVEAERENVNVNADPHDRSGGGTGFPKLERNSIDAASATTSDTARTFSDRSSDVRPRRSIVGGEKERGEVLAAIKKGILKRNGTDSGSSSPKPGDPKSADFVLPQLPRFSDSPNSSSPSTPEDDRTARGHRRTDSVTIEGEDYFMTMGRFGTSESKSMPGTPRSITARNISFSPRIQFHDTFTSGEYDRRGEIATCNRLTPMLAQQIKEELNTFKMEMEVHESSKVYTHFF